MIYKRHSAAAFLAEGLPPNDRTAAARSTKNSADRVGIPHHGDIVVQPSGSGARLDPMYEFHAPARDPATARPSKHDANGSVFRWCNAVAHMKLADVIQAFVPRRYR